MMRTHCARHGAAGCGMWSPSKTWHKHSRLDSSRHLGAGACVAHGAGQRRTALKPWNLGHHKRHGVPPMRTSSGSTPTLSRTPRRKVPAQAQPGSTDSGEGCRLSASHATKQLNRGHTRAKNEPLDAVASQACRMHASSVHVCMPKLYEAPHTELVCTWWQSHLV